MDPLVVAAILAVVVVLIFDFTNGFTDAANIIATVIASRAMTPIQAVVVVAVFEFLGPVLGGTAVANTIGHFIDVSPLPPTHAVVVVLAGVLGGIAWNLITWWIGIPSSSSHALIGGLIGAVVIAAGVDSVHWGFADLANGRVDGVAKVLIGLIISPIVGFGVGFGIQRLMMRLLAGARPRLNTHLRRAQFITSAGLAFSHGANDAQKSMGIITLVLVISGQLSSFVVPTWVILACAATITVGILLGGWRIVRTVGFGIYKVRPLHAFDTQLTASTVILTASVFGAPVSTTHVVSSSIMGIGTAEQPRAVRWAKAQEIVSTWIVTIPASALVGAIGFLAGDLVVN